MVSSFGLRPVSLRRLNSRRAIGHQRDVLGAFTDSGGMWNGITFSW